MKENINQDCPLCASRASYYLVGQGNRKYFNCVKCRLFQISVGAEKVLIKGLQQQRDYYAQKVLEATEDNALVILLPELSDGLIDTGEALIWDFVPRAKLPR
jgi:hypothetical protein